MLTTPAQPSRDDPIQALHAAARTGDVAGIRQWLPKVKDATCRRAALYQATSNNQQASVIALLDGGVNIREKYDDCFVGAVKYGHIDMARLLIARGADIHAENDRALHVAATNGYLDIVRELVAAGSDINRGRALAGAAKHGHIEIVRFLLGKGADCNCPREDPPLNGSRRRNQIEITRMLLEHGANMPLDAGFVRAAVRDEQIEIVALYLDHGLPINDIRHPLLEFAINPQGNEAMCRMLLARGADPLQKHGMAISIAISHCRVDILEMFIEHGCNINRCHDDVLEFGLQSESPDVVRIFLAHLANQEKIRQWADNNPDMQNIGLVRAHLLHQQLEENLGKERRPSEIDLASPRQRTTKVSVL